MAFSTATAAAAGLASLAVPALFPLAVAAGAIALGSIVYRTWETANDDTSPTRRRPAQPCDETGPQKQDDKTKSANGLHLVA